MEPLPEGVTACLPAALYLLGVCAVLGSTGRVPTWVHPTAASFGVVAHAMIVGWASAALSGGVAAAIFVVLVLIVGGTVTGVTLFSLTVTLALTPVAGWFGLLCGLVISAVAALVRTWRHLGSGRVTWLAMDTFDALGVSPGGRFKKPDLDLIPDRDGLTDVHDGTDQASRLTMYLPPYLLVGIAIAAAMSTLGV